MNESLFQNLTSALENNNVDAAQQVLHEISASSLSDVDRGKILAELAMVTMRLEMNTQKPYQETLESINGLIKLLQSSEQELSDMSDLQSARDILK